MPSGGLLLRGTFAPFLCSSTYILTDRVLMVSVIILHLLRLVGDGSVLYVEARQKEVRLAGIAIKEAQEKPC